MLIKTEAMNIKTICLFTVLSTLVPFLSAEEKGADIPLEAPAGWGGETIDLPPGFAPGMKLQGLEKIRFAPGMFKPATESFFSYAFVFRLGPKQDLSLKTVREEILVYYRGLARAVGGEGIETGKFTFNPEKVEPSKGNVKKTPGVIASAGVLDWIEPFRTKKPQKLRLEIHTWKGKTGKYSYLFCCASPAAPAKEIWKELRGVRAKFMKERPAAASLGTANWPSFRGQDAAGVADGQDLPDEWNFEKGENIRWKKRIPGLAHSSPVIWGDRLFVTSAISSKADASFKPGLYGDPAADADNSKHRWMVYCLDKKSGKTIWESLATDGSPREKRHIKATFANSSPVTDGRYLVAFFGSQGLFGFDLDGKKLWSKDLGRLDAGAHDLPEYEWGTASSPVIYGDLVIVQCDVQKKSFILAADVETGETRWKTDRDELPSWGTPAIVEGPKGPELVTNSSNFIRGYDPLTGKELWRLGGSSKITAPTPVFSDGLIIVSSGRHPERPIFAVRAGSRGDLTLAKGETSNAGVAWSMVRRGPYMPTPVIYKGLLYVLHNNGLLDCYELVSGKELYRQRIRHGGSGFSASPVAADGKLYLPSEDGDIFVIRAGREFKQLARNSMGEFLMATPALSGGALYVRAHHHLVAIGR
ncbi:MAG: PQQ-binding-like beta-propeller repeat protein [Planctomycetota bacterium]|nr:PQQ-binding-like beta-propeller repeat protein [Planctomycetota bacterium]MEE3296631.1 PQQ-binding-like beta-propeller repeat protein [Planctomycetota bacterium]